MLAENRFDLIKLTAHVHALRSLPGKHAHDRRIAVFANCSHDESRIESLQRTNRAGRITTRNCPAISKLLAADLQRVSHVGQVCFRMLDEIKREIWGGGFGRG